MSISLTTIALAIFVVCAGFVLLRGIMRILLGCLVLGSSAWVGFRLWLLAPDLVKACFGMHLQWLATVIPIAAFLFTFLIGRFLVKFFSTPFQASDGERPPLTLSRLLGAALFTLVPTCLVVTLLAILIYHAGSVSEIQQSAGTSAPSRASELFQNLKSSVEKSIPPAWLKLFDPLADPSRLTLAKIITAQSQPQRPPEIDPQTGKPIPRAVIVNDPELQNLARDGKFTTLLRSPLLTKALNDPKVQALLKNF
ncbi:MAG: hypothetical protein NTV46_18125 [Verrucomicrobia bacterium]|nr:hypothetical protein [Verrucomicrobiota bacterium]